MKRHLILLASLLSVSMCITTQTACSDDDKDEPLENKKDTSTKDPNSNPEVKGGDTVTGRINNIAYVDLGLSVKWAAQNVKANNIHSLGRYYAWGDVLGGGTCKFTDYVYKTPGSYTMSKYCTEDVYGKIDNIKVLEEIDDAATVNCGDQWRMPTVAELEELADNCKWEYVENYDGYKINGFKGVSKKNGNIIFMPETSFIDGDGAQTLQNSTWYWSASLSVFSSDAEALYFSKKATAGVDNVARYVGFQIRAVVK